jgi:hypothetical protein
MLPTKEISCPYCGEPIDLVIDDSINHQAYVEDCSVCCRPIEIEVSVVEPGEIQVTCRTDSET